jgi:hypothetical protein
VEKDVPEVDVRVEADSGAVDPTPREEARRQGGLMQLCWMVLLLSGIAADAQVTGTTRRKLPNEVKPACSAAAICFSGEVLEGEEFRKALTPDLDFVLKPGWTIAITPKKTEGHCNELASVVNAPYRTHRDLDIDMGYGWTAEQEVYHSPREFRFVTNCAEYRIEMDRLQIVLWHSSTTQQKVEEAQAKLGSSALGKGRLWIIDSRISHADDTDDNKLGKIQWMRFIVEILLPNR